MKRTQANDLIDREARDRMARAVDRYLNEEITAFEFDDDLMTISSDTEDQTVREIMIGLWGQYDDFTDHKVVASKESWDYMQRLLLILKSNARLEVPKRRRWTHRQSIAISFLTLFLTVVIYADSGILACFAYVVVGVVSLALLHWHERLSEPDSAMVPFSSLTEIVKVRKSVPSFSKQSYPPHLKLRAIRSPLLEMIHWRPIHDVLWFAVSPLALLFQSFPERPSECSVVLDE